MRLFRPKYTVTSLAGLLARGLQDGSIIFESRRVNFLSDFRGTFNAALLSLRGLNPDQQDLIELVDSLRRNLDEFIVFLEPEVIIINTLMRAGDLLIDLATHKLSEAWGIVNGVDDLIQRAIQEADARNPYLELTEADKLIDELWVMCGMEPDEAVRKNVETSLRLLLAIALRKELDLLRNIVAGKTVSALLEFGPTGHQLGLPKYAGVLEYLAQESLRPIDIEKRYTAAYIRVLFRILRKGPDSLRQRDPENEVSDDLRFAEGEHQS